MQAGMPPRASETRLTPRGRLSKINVPHLFLGDMVVLRVLFVG